MNNKKQRKAPVLRFKGFTDDWEQRKLKDIANRVIQKNKGNDILPVLTNSADLGIVLQNDYFDKTIAKNLNNYYIVSHNDFVYNPRISKNAPFGPINRNKLNIQGVMSPLYLVFRFNSQIDLNFLEYYFQSSKWHPFMYKNGDSGARADRFAIKNSVLMNMTIDIPTLDQQKRIGKIFLLLENSITLQQRKLSMLKRLKKEYLFKMFPIRGKDYNPILRFRGYTDNWKQQKLEKIAEFNPKSQLPHEFEYVDLESVVGTKMVAHKRMLLKNSPSRAQRLAQKGDIFYQMVRPYQKNNYLFNQNSKNYVFSTGYAQIRPKINGNFLFHLIQTDQFVKEVLNNCTGTSYPAINSKDLSRIIVIYSKNASEQHKIGKYFEILDQQIISQEQKIDLLEKTKKFFLQKMFI